MMSVTSKAQANADVMKVLKEFRLIFKSVKRHFQWMEKQTGVSGAQLWAMSAVVEQPGIRVTDLGKTMAIHQSTTSNLVERLVQAGLLRRERLAKDQRVVQLYPTAKGARLVKKAPSAVRGVLMDGLERLSARELTTLDGALSALIGKMDVKDSSGRRLDLTDV
jgi:DNA-binding MarR family transcriptional regulator